MPCKKCAVQGLWGDGLGGLQWWVMGLVWWGSGLPWPEGGVWGIWERACGSLAPSLSSLKCVGEQWPHLGVIQGTHQVGLLRCKAQSALAAQVVGHLWVLPTVITVAQMGTTMETETSSTSYISRRLCDPWCKLELRFFIGTGFVWCQWLSSRLCYSSPDSSGAADVPRALQFPFFSPTGVRNRSIESTAKQIPLVLSPWN